VGESCWGLNTRSEDHLLSFSTSPQTHVSNAHNHGYGHFGIATCRVSSVLENRVIERVGDFGTITDNSKITTF
jgi:hypothetical protein